MSDSVGFVPVWLVLVLDIAGIMSMSDNVGFVPVWLVLVLVIVGTMSDSVDIVPEFLSFSWPRHDHHDLTLTYLICRSSHAIIAEKTKRDVGF